MDKYIFHIDLNAFYAVAEQIRNPELKGKPVAIAGKRRRGIITTATYEAREFGVKSAMNVSEALKLCPDLIVVVGEHSYYSELSNKFVDFLKTYTDQVEQVSIDECYLDLTNEIKNYEKPLDLAIEIRDKLYELYQLKCSIGVSINRFLAKMASDMHKPMGVTIIRESEIVNKIFPIDIANMHGIGIKTSPILKENGIKNIGDLLKENKYTTIKSILGKNTDATLDKIQGIGNDKISLDESIKSIGNSSTFIEAVTDYDIISQKFLTLAKSVARRLNKEDLVSNNITVTIRTSDFVTITRSKTLDYDLSESDEIYEEALLLYDNENIDDSVRLVGIACGNLKLYEDSITQLKLEL